MRVSTVLVRYLRARNAELCGGGGGVGGAASARILEVIGARPLHYRDVAEDE